ncbi:VanZ family protein [Noviherbaspirillum aridicola]|uniref:VanZ-like domain-containing protein n=1 Tax=Noviherbaspirillum aridicola TaxID=2849687 RepID=A0ABQ4Q4C6_9BURK|nr:VanZ family protein [Noviherbaspirillum aridicola]GIZ51604.1 hypothetical protein NCCP691_16180 [Noviherbaspirillum aridicola]
MRLLHALIDPRFTTLRLRAAWAAYLSILIFGAIPGARTEIGEYASGLVLHFFAYGCISFLLFTGFVGHPGARLVRCVLLIALMGAGDEFMQSFLPYRRGAISDWYVDVSAGIVVSTLLWASAFRVKALRVTRLE